MQQLVKTSRGALSERKPRYMACRRVARLMLFVLFQDYGLPTHVERFSKRCVTRMYECVIADVCLFQAAGGARRRETYQEPSSEAHEQPLEIYPPVGERAELGVPVQGRKV